MKPGERGREAGVEDRPALREKQGRGTCEKLCVEHVNRLVVPGVLTLQVDGVQKVLDEGGQDHGEQDGVLKERQRPANSGVARPSLAQSVE